MNNDVECLVKTAKGYVESVGRLGITYVTDADDAFIFPCLEAALDMKETFDHEGIACEIVTLDEE